jgi:alanyl-tRNA synthetase
MKGSEVRRAFLDYFVAQGHTEIQSSPLVPANDPTLLFSNAGMNQFKDCFLGAEKRAYARATTCQKCLRISGKHNDFENVGVTARHHTFFEMLGNFSFGDYFKREAIAYAWELVTKVLKVDTARLWVTIFESDDEAFQIWRDVAGVPAERIVRLGEADNFWAMGDTGPCGPCSEIHYYRGEDLSKQSAEGLRSDGASYLEFYNLVFMQYNRSADGTLIPLPKPAVDTGMGLERITSILNGVPANYDTDLLKGVITLTEQLTGYTYDGRSYVQKDLKKDLAYARDVAMRVIADHSRSAAFLIGDGVQPGSDGRGYVLRRILRRAVRHGRVLNFKAPFLKETCNKVIEVFGAHYPELIEHRDLILRVVDAEERKFHETLDAGLSILTKEVESLKKGAQFPGETAFLLHDTYGFPLDLTEDALKPYGVTVDSAAFTSAMEAQRDRSREDRRSQGISYAAVTLEGVKTSFTGYSSLTGESRITNVITSDADYGIVVEETPFYGESGGQVGDVGTITVNGVVCEVIDTQKAQDGYVVHQCKVRSGDPKALIKGARAQLSVDGQKRAEIRAHHSATHLVHAALRAVLGTHVKQAGSRVDGTSSRFDYSHFAPVEPSQLEEIQSRVNEEIRKNHEVVTELMSIDEAKKSGAMALFGEKYGETVRVVEIGEGSRELCGGTHALRSGDLGALYIISEGGIAAGVRRIECVTAHSGYSTSVALQREHARLNELLKGDSVGLAAKIERVLQRTKDLEKHLEIAKSKLAVHAASELFAQAKTSPQGIRYLATHVAEVDAESLKNMVDSLRVKIGSGVIALATTIEGKSLIITGVTADLAGKVHAGNLVKEAAKVANGKGGGRPDFAQAGGLDPSKIQAGLEALVALV